MKKPKSSTAESASSARFRKVGENLYRLASTRTYYALLKKGDKQFRRSLKTRDRKLAERRLATLRTQVGNLSLHPDTKLTFKQIGDRWIEITKHTWKPTSLYRRQVCLDNVDKFLHGKTIRNLTTLDCEKWLTQRGPKIAAQTFAHELGTMKSIFAYAVKNGLLMSNPAAEIKRKKIVQAKIVVPSREEFKKLIETIRQSDGRPDSQQKATPGADLVELLAYSGCRLGEATALRWADVNFERNCLTISGGDYGTKNSEARTIPMTSALHDLLQRLHKEKKPQPTDLISLIKDAKKCLHTGCRRMKCHQFTHHDFRHFFATTCIESGVDIPTVSKWLGHKDGGALAMKVYGHLRQEHSFSMIKRVNFGDIKPANVVPICEASNAGN